MWLQKILQPPSKKKEEKDVQINAELTEYYKKALREIEKKLGRKNKNEITKLYLNLEKIAELSSPRPNVEKIGYVLQLSKKEKKILEKMVSLAEIYQKSRKR